MRVLNPLHKTIFVSTCMNRLLLIVSLCCLALCASAREYADTAVYQGMSVKLDVGNSVFELARSAGKIQSYEAAINVRLAKRFYPTIEAGYAMAERGADGGMHKGQGGFGRIGMDLAVVKKGASENNMLVGLRFGSAYQNYDLTNVKLYSDYWGEQRINFYNQQRFDCWGEIVAGCQVQVYKGFQMGWYVRMKLLFTRNAKEGEVMPYYIPGLGFRKDFNWGFNYYLAYKF